MKRIAISVAALAAGLIVALAWATAPEPGSWAGKRAEGGSDWVSVKNLHSINSYNHTFTFNEQCIPDYGIIKVVAEDGDNLLVRYKAEGRAAGTLCASGTLFFITKNSFKEGWNPLPSAAAVAQEAQRAAEVTSQEKAHIKALLAGQR